MSQTREQIRDTLDILLSDPKDQKWSETHKNHFINQALSDVVSSMSVPYVRTSDIAIRHDTYEYEFPDDMLEPLAMMLQDIEGEIIVSSSWRSLLGSIDSGNTMIPNDPTVFWETYNRASGYVTLRDIVSDNKFIFTPKYDADLLNVTVYEQDNLPSTASEDEIWVDSFGSENFVYKCSSTYDASSDQTTGTLAASYLPSATDLVFTYDITGVKYVKVVIVDGGSSGVASVAITGDADDRSDPLTYTFTIFDDTSNNTIIALSPANLTITGADASTSGSVTATSLDLDNPAEAKWTQQVIHLRYNAVFPGLSTDTDTLPDELHVLLRQSDCIAYIAAYKLLITVKGDERLIIMARQYKKEYESILERAHEHRMGSGPPFDLEPA